MDDCLCSVQVKDAALAVDPHLVAMACGSYRRGKATCGDVDVLISHPDGKSHKGVFAKVLQSLHDSGEPLFCFCFLLNLGMEFILFSPALTSLLFASLRFSDGWPGEPRGEWRAEEVHGRVPVAGAGPSPSQAGYHRGAAQRVRLCAHVFYRVGTLQPLYESPGQDEKDEFIRALAESKCGAWG